MMTLEDFNTGLLGFLDASPTPFHATQNMSMMCANSSQLYITDFTTTFPLDSQIIGWYGVHIIQCVKELTSPYNLKIICLRFNRYWYNSQVFNYRTKSVLIVMSRYVYLTQSFAFFCVNHFSLKSKCLVFCSLIQFLNSHIL